MILTINGKREEVGGSSLTVVDLLKVKGVAMPEMVSVQVNGEILNRGELAATLVKDNDRVEFLYFMGGGSQSRRSPQGQTEGRSGWGCAKTR